MRINTKRQAGGVGKSAMYGGMNERERMLNKQELE